MRGVELTVSAGAPTLRTPYTRRPPSSSLREVYRIHLPELSQVVRLVVVESTAWVCSVGYLV
jgi:hypothetical protein